MNDLNTAMKLMDCFPGSFINHNGEFIAHRKANEYFNYAACESELDVKAKVLEHLSRGASKSEPFNTERANGVFRRFMQDGINKYLGTSFTQADFDTIYTYLGNGCNHTRTIRFIASGYNVELLPFREEDA